MGKKRAACIITDGERFLICHAPNKKNGPHSWDLPKGHYEEGDLTVSVTAWRELKEETGLEETDLDIELNFTTRPYKYGPDDLSFLIIRVNKLPEKELVCTSMFEWEGEELPEVNEYQWCTFDELKEKLYWKLSALVPKVLEEHQNLWKVEKS